eukprot:6477389-Amphidinium_carterae.1
MEPAPIDLTNYHTFTSEVVGLSSSKLKQAHSSMCTTLTTEFCFTPLARCSEKTAVETHCGQKEEWLGEGATETATLQSVRFGSSYGEITQH